MHRSLVLLLLTWTGVVDGQMDVLIKVGINYMPQNRTHSLNNTLSEDHMCD